VRRRQPTSARLSAGSERPDSAPLAAQLRLGHNLFAMVRSDDCLLPAAELRLRKHKRSIIAAGALILLLPILFFVFAERPTLDAIKVFQAQRHASKAFALIEQEKWPRA